MKKKFKYALLACFAIAVFYGCKRETMVNNAETRQIAAVQKLRNWFESLQPTTTAKKDAVKTINLPAADMQWSRAIYYPDDKVWITPMTIKKNSSGSTAFVFFTASEDKQGSIANGSYVVLVPDSKKMTAAAIQAFTVLPAMLNFTNVPAGFSGAIFQYSMDKAFVQAKHYESGVLQPGKTDLLTAKAGSSGANDNPSPNIVDECEGGEIICTDWYWQTWVDGILVNEEFLFTICACEGGEGGGGGGISTCQQICQAAMNNFVAAGRVVSGPVSEITNTQDNTEWNKTYVWKIYDAVTWFLHSKENAVLEKVYYPSSGQSLWQFKSIVHDKIVSSGASIGGDRTSTDLGANINKTLFSAQVRIDFSVTHKILCNDCPTPIPPVTEMLNANTILRIAGTISYSGNKSDTM
jgi:hypothetical protein